MVLTFNFDEKVLALATIRALGVKDATNIISRQRRMPAPMVREALDKMYDTHYLTTYGVIEISTAQALLFTEFRCPQQPVALNESFFYSCNAYKQQALNEALEMLNCSGLYTSMKPLPIIVKDRRYAKAKS